MLLSLGDNTNCPAQEQLLDRGGAISGPASVHCYPCGWSHGGQAISHGLAGPCRCSCSVTLAPGFWTSFITSSSFFLCRIQATRSPTAGKVILCKSPVKRCSRLQPMLERLVTPRPAWGVTPSPMGPFASLLCRVCLGQTSASGVRPQVRRTLDLFGAPQVDFDALGPSKGAFGAFLAEVSRGCSAWLMGTSQLDQNVCVPPPLLPPTQGGGKLLTAPRSLPH